MNEGTSADSKSTEEVGFGLVVNDKSTRLSLYEHN